MQDPPEWYEEASYQRQDDSRIKVRVEVCDDSHGGYCSDHDGLTVTVIIEELYLPDGNWDFGTCEWQEYNRHCSCCDARLYKKVLSIERLPASTT